MNKVVFESNVQDIGSLRSLQGYIKIQRGHAFKFKSTQLIVMSKLVANSCWYIYDQECIRGGGGGGGYGTLRFW